jgi:hypothetical protein
MTHQTYIDFEVKIDYDVAGDDITINSVEIVGDLVVKPSNINTLIAPNIITPSTKLEEFLVEEILAEIESNGPQD